MISETWYVTKDGTKFNDYELAKAHEAELIAAEEKAKAEADDKATLTQKIKEAEEVYTNLLKEYAEKYGDDMPTCGGVFGFGVTDDFGDMMKMLDVAVSKLFS